MTWIVVPNWERFQHYADRDPVWIKIYTELAHRDDWRHLTLAERGLLVSIWIEYALCRGQLRSSDLPAAVTQKIPRRSLDSLQEAGFIEVSASKPTRTRTRTRSREEEEEKDLPKKVSKSKDGRKVTGWREIRGSHGITHVPDPAGTDRPPFELKGM
jgi:hypothetical protein